MRIWLSERAAEANPAAGAVVGRQPGPARAEGADPGASAGAGRGRGLAVGVVVAALVIWFARRPQQLSHPYVWVEEGEILFRYAEHGWWGALQPMSAGYEIFPVNLLVPLAAWLSWAHLPALTYAFATGLFVATIGLLVWPDSRWGGPGVRAACALLLALNPADPETFGVLLYGFWWTALWPLIILGWRRDHYRLRIPLLVLASLGSPAGGALWAVFGLSFLRSRARRDLVSAAALLPGFLLQVVLVRTAGSQQQTARGGDLSQFASEIAGQVVRPVGLFATRWLTPPVFDPVFLVVLGVTILGLLLAVALRRPREESEPVLLLWCSTVVYLVLCAVAAPMMIDPSLVGRYLFLPYAALAWTLVVLAARTRAGHERVVAICLVAASTFVLPTTFSRPPDSIDGRLWWRQEVAACAQHEGAEPYPIPIYFDGSQARLWRLYLTAEQCRALARGSLTGS